MKAHVRTMAGLRPLPPALLAVGPIEGRIKALREWGHRLGHEARKALAIVSRLEPRPYDRCVAAGRIADFFGLRSADHCFHSDPIRWFRLTENQATKGLEHFLSDRRSARALHFLKALDPTITWPKTFERVVVQCEVPTSCGRIDLMITGHANGVAWGAVIEAKFGHSLRDNPLPDYASHAQQAGLPLVVGAGGQRRATLVVLGLRACNQTRRRLARNPAWRFVHWSALLRRFDRGFKETSIDAEFQRFRRTLWERGGGVG